MSKNKLFFLSGIIFILMLVGVYVFAAKPNPGHSWSEMECDSKMCVGDNVGMGTTSPSYKLHVTGDIYANPGWIRTSGQTGWYNQSYGGGWYMTDATWLRAYNNKPVYSGSEIRSGSLLRAPLFRDLDSETYYVDPSGNTSAVLNGSVGIGRVPNYTLDVGGRVRVYNPLMSLGSVNPASLTVGRAADGYDAIRGYTDGTNSSAIIGVATGTGQYSPNYGLYSWGGVVINRYYGTAANGDITQANLYFSGYNHGIFWGNSGPVFVRNNNFPHIESTADGNLWLSAGADGGTVYLQTSHQNGDVAEYYRKKSGEKIEAGDVVSIAEDEDERVTLSKMEYDSKVVGVVSTSPGLIIGVGDGNKDLVPLALVGRVSCKVTNINGQIKRGDLLTTSPIPGYAMKATKSGPIIGKALQNFNGKKGKILIFANTGWYNQN